ncbi:hypothetical protein, partial [Roseixanthobacter pseudopolyaromaticivorans]|uniref:hypothetical protein n=1 Tax=Xanthobacteraceae TaxID=335928 RepID=UPI00372CA97C
LKTIARETDAAEVIVQMAHSARRKPFSHLACELCVYEGGANLAASIIPFQGHKLQRVARQVPRRVRSVQYWLIIGFFTRNIFFVRS